MSEKPVIWLGDSRERIRAFPEDVRMIAGFQSVQEIRIRTGAEHRVLYVARFAEAIYVLHAFEKRTRRTPQEALDLAGQRLRSLINRRTQRKG
jgi:phage-related protein